MQSAADLGEPAGSGRPQSPLLRGTTGLTVRMAVLLGFGLTFAIWLFTGYYFTRRIAEVESRSAIINARYIQSQEILSTVRAQTLLGSVYVGDALLDPDPSTIPAYRRRFDAACRTVDQALAQYVPVLDSDAERARVARLRRDITDFRETMLHVLAAAGGRYPSDARSLLSTQVAPKRELVIGVSEQVQTLNRSAFVRQQAALAEIYGAAQRRILIILSFALAASVGVGLLATLYAARLEDRVRRQRARDVQNARDLQKLSAKLILAQEAERSKIARELHDEVGQVLTAIKVELAVAQRTIDAVDGSPKLLDDARSMTENTLVAVRDLSHLLHPALLDDLGLPAAIEWYLRGFGVRHGIRVEVLHENMDERLTPEIEASVYRIVQEALTNVANHANARLCRVYLQRLTATVLVTVEDDGMGFEAAQQSGGRRGLGLIGIRQRVTELKGTMRLDSAPGKGTRLTVELPARVRLNQHAMQDAQDRDSVAADLQHERIRG